MNSILKSYLNEVKKREESATGGPWKYSPVKAEGFEAYSTIHGYQRSVQHRDFIRDFDAEFMAHSRVDVFVLHKMLTDCLEVIEKRTLGERDIEELIGRLERRIQQAGV